MFQVEITAKAKADEMFQSLIDEGYDNVVASKAAGEYETDLITAGTKWITENVGLD